MAEWLKAHAWKACIGETLSRVRIPVSPPFNLLFLPGRRKYASPTPSLGIESAGSRHSDRHYDSRQLARVCCRLVTWRLQATSSIISAAGQGSPSPGLMARSRRSAFVSPASSLTSAPFNHPIDLTVGLSGQRRIPSGPTVLLGNSKCSGDLLSALAENKELSGLKCVKLRRLR